MHYIYQPLCLSLYPLQVTCMEFQELQTPVSACSDPNKQYKTYTSDFSCLKMNRMMPLCLFIYKMNLVQWPTTHWFWDYTLSCVLHTKLLITMALLVTYSGIFFFRGLHGRVLPYWWLDAKRPCLFPSSRLCGPRSLRTKGRHQLSRATYRPPSISRWSNGLSVAAMTWWWTSSGAIKARYSARVTWPNPTLVSRWWCFALYH